jgi:hypothetical protein
VTEEAQKKLVRANLPILDDMLATFSTSMLLWAHSFARNRPIWDGKKGSKQTWDARKAFFKPLQLVLEREMEASSDQPNTFGTAAVAQCYHGINPNCPGVGKEIPGQPGDADDLIAQLDSHFNNLALAAMNNNAALD